jgi:chemotaxis family two-component system response regulator Rcp1
LARKCRILIAEDSRADVFLIREALRKAKIDADIYVAEDGEQAIRYLETAERDRTPAPDVVLLDINLPRYKGGDILRRLRRSDAAAGTLVLVVTSSNSAADRDEMNVLGADGYFRKPSDYAEFMKLGPIVRELLERKAPPAAG